MSIEEKAKKLAEAQGASAAIDWNARREWYLSQLNELYQTIRNWLRPLGQQKLVTISTIKTRLSEQYIGDYEADRLTLDFSGQAVLLEPQGAVIFGSRGRVDVYRRGRYGEPVMLLLSGEDAPQWEIWTSRNPRERQPLTEQSFKDLLDSLL